jgi:hypothetical protein
MSATRVSVYVNEFRHSHVHLPRGYGMWAFRVNNVGCYATDGDLMFITGLYSTALAQAKQRARAGGFRNVHVLP